MLSTISQLPAFAGEFYRANPLDSKLLEQAWKLLNEKLLFAFEEFLLVRSELMNFRLQI